MASNKEQFFILKKVSFNRNHHIVLNVLISPVVKENVGIRWGRMSLGSPMADHREMSSGVLGKASGWDRGMCAHCGECPGIHLGRH